MTETERVVLALVQLHLREWRCRECGLVWLSGKSQAGVFHRCRRKRETFSRFRGTEERNAEEARRWAERALGMSPVAAAIEDELGDRALLPVEEKES